MITPDELIPEPREYVLRNGAPDTIAGWKALVDGLLTDQACAFHRNLEISSRYAWIYKYLPATGVGSLPFTNPADAARHATSAYTLPFCPQLPRRDGDIVSEWLGSDPCRCGWSRHRNANGALPSRSRPRRGPTATRSLPSGRCEQRLAPARALIRRRRSRDRLRSVPGWCRCPPSPS